MKQVYIKPDIEIYNVGSDNLMTSSKPSNGCTCGCSSADPTHLGCYNCDKCNHDNSDNHNCWKDDDY